MIGYERAASAALQVAVGVMASRSVWAGRVAAAAPVVADFAAAVATVTDAISPASPGAEYVVFVKAHWRRLPRR
jgi:hypothetical protein